MNRLRIDQKKYTYDPELFGNDKMKEGDAPNKVLNGDYDYYVIPYTKEELINRRVGNQKVAHVLLMKKSKAEEE